LLPFHPGRAYSARHPPRDTEELRIFTVSEAVWTPPRSPNYPTDLHKHLVARAGIEPATFRSADESDCGTSPFVLVRPEMLDQQAVVEPGSD
jgi:hypothetical protein